MKNFILEDLNALKTVLNSDLTDLQLSFAEAVSMCLRCLKNGNKILIGGNGGSAADAEHFAGEIVGRFGFDRPSLPCISLCTPSATFTAIANDYGYDNVFKRQVQGYARPGDILIGISTSGNSANVVEAFAEAKKVGIKTVALTGNRVSKLNDMADVCLAAPSSHTPRIQEIHAIIIHSMCRTIEHSLFPGKAQPMLPANKIVGSKQLKKLAQAIKPHRSVFTNGCFDVLHPGHVYVLQQARQKGDLLIVGLNSDASVSRLKGESRPYHRFQDRANVLAALEAVDYVCEFSEDTPSRLIETLTPKVLVKGGDYNRDTIAGADWVCNNGGEVCVIPLLQGHSTTGILNKNEQ
jgi:D-sedoheptulose 7-phosphate isomerase